MLSVTPVLKKLMKGNLETKFLLSLPKIKAIYKIHSSTEKQTQMIFLKLKKRVWEEKRSSTYEK